MATLQDQKPKDTYKDLLQRANSNSGMDATLRIVSGGNGVDTPLRLATQKVLVKPTTDSTTVFEVHDKDGNVMFTVDTTNNKLIAASGVTWEGNGANLTGITGATGGVSNTDGTNIVSDSDADGVGDITFTINVTDIAKIKNNGTGTGGVFEVSETGTHVTPDAGFVGISAESDQLVRVDESGNKGVILTDDRDYIKKSLEVGITASVTQSQGQQLLSKEVNEVSTVANDDDVVTMPSAEAGLQITVINNGSNNLQIFPTSGDNLGSGVDTSITLMPDTNITLVAYDTTNWEIVFESNPVAYKNISTKTTHYTVSAKDHYLLCDASSGDMTLTLPSPRSGMNFMIKKTDSSTNKVIIATTGAETIDGYTTFTIDVENWVTEFFSDSSNWYAN